MGFFDKVKGLFSRVYNKVIKPGWRAVKKFVAPIYNVAKPIINSVVPGGGAITAVADKVLPVIQALPDDAGQAIKQGGQMLYERLKK